MTAITISSVELLQRIFEALHRRHVAMTLSQLEQTLGPAYTDRVRTVVLDALNAHHRTLLNVLSVGVEK